MAHLVWRQNDGATGHLGETTTTWYIDTGILVDADTHFNTNYSWSTSGEAGKYDVQNVGAHEYGHWLALDEVFPDVHHPENPSETMFYTAGLGETFKRSLNSGDIQGIKAIYGVP